MSNNIEWAKVIAYVLRLIADGLDKNKAVSQTSDFFNISKESIIEKLKR